MKLVMVGACMAMFALSGCVDDGAAEGTYRGQTGYDPATANMSMCSDGVLREDCRTAPLGY